MLTLKATSALVGVVFLLTASQLLAQSPVEDRTRSPAPDSELGQAPVVTNTTPAESPQTALFDDFQSMREELSRLTGLVEELSYEIRQMKSRQVTDYSDLDARLQRLNAGTLTGSPTASVDVTMPTTLDGSTDTDSQTASVDAGVITGSAPAVSASSDASEMYARGLTSLRNGDREAALADFSMLVVEHPTSAVAADSYYWMAETHWVAGNYESAREAYDAIEKGFPEHRRYSDALFKLGRVYHTLGDDSSAIGYLEQASQLGGASGQMAAQLLSEINSN